MTPRPEQTEEALIARILALEESGMSREMIQATLTEEGHGQEALDYLALFDLLTDERDRMDVTLSTADRYTLGKEERTRFSSINKLWETFMSNFSSRYALAGGALLLLVLVTVNLSSEEQVAEVNTPKGETPVAVAPKTEGSVTTPTVPVVPETPSAPTPSVTGERSDIDALILAVGASEGVETFADDDAELDVSSDDALIDNNTMYDESLL